MKTKKALASLTETVSEVAEKVAHAHDDINELSTHHETAVRLLGAIADSLERIADALVEKDRSDLEHAETLRQWRKGKR